LSALDFIRCVAEILSEPFSAPGVRPIKPQSPDDAIIAAVRELQVNRQPPLVIALDGRSGVGKSTRAALIALQFGGAIIPGDDFFAGGTDAWWAQQTASEKVDGCIDWRRLKDEVLIPLRAGRVATWHPFDFAAGVGLAVHLEHRDPAPVVIFEGIYSARPELRNLVDLAVLIEMHDDGARRQRLLEREGQPFMDAWHALWDAAEDEYFALVCPRESFDLIVQTD
jgi:para-aminobenzoate synthetase